MHDLDGNVIAEYDAIGALLTEYVWLEDRPIAVIADAGTTPVTYWVHTDQLERPVMMTDDTSAVVWQASYLPFGEVASITGPANLDYRFPGQWFQLESGLAYNWHRHYDATTGRYLQPDPLGMPDGPSRWAYVENSPFMMVDPTGLQGDGTPKSNQAQNRQIRDICRELSLNKDQRQQLHRLISGAGLSYGEIKAIAIDEFRK